MKLHITEINGGIRVEVKVQPRSSRNQVAGEQNGVLKIKLTASPVDGKANAALIGFMAAHLHLPPKDISLFMGETSRRKIVEIRGLNAAEFSAKIRLNYSSSPE